MPRWANQLAAPIAVTAIALGGYSLAAQRIEAARHAASLDALQTTVAALADTLADLSAEGESSSLPPATTLSPRRQASGTTTNVADAQVGELRNALSGLAADVDALRFEVDEHGDRAPFDAWQADDEEAQAEFEANATDDGADRLSEHFEAEAHDPEWSAAAERDIDDAIASRPMEGMRLGDVECRSSVCRLALTVADRRTALQLAPFLPHALPWNGESRMRVDGDRLVLFVAREGFGFEDDGSD